MKIRFRLVYQLYLVEPDHIMYRWIRLEKTHLFAILKNRYKFSVTFYLTFRVGNDPSKNQKTHVLRNDLFL